MPYKISIVNHADQQNPDHWVQKVSNRRQRALKLARSLRAAGNSNVMLFHVQPNGSLLPVSLSEEANIKFVGATQGSLLPRSNTDSTPRKAVSRPIRDTGHDVLEMGGSL
jgi:hypothetical protein